MSNRTHRSRVLLAASALTLTAGTAFAEELGVGIGTSAGIDTGVGVEAGGTTVHVGTGTSADADAGVTVITPRAQPGNSGAEVEAGAGTTTTLSAPPSVNADAATAATAPRPATLAAWTPDDLIGASVVNETGMRIATVDGVVADAGGTVDLVLTIDAQPGAKRAVAFDRFELGTSGNALLLVGASDADLVAMADYVAAAYTPITTDAQLQAHLSTAAGN